MRLATIATARGLRLHVKARTGYVDVADATDDVTLGSLRGVLEAETRGHRGSARPAGPRRRGNRAGGLGAGRT